MRKCFWRLGQAETEYKLLQTFRGGKAGGRQQSVALLPTGRKTTSEATPIDACVSETTPENTAQEQRLISSLQSIDIYVFSV